MPVRRLVENLLLTLLGAVGCYLGWMLPQWRLDYLDTPRERLLRLEVYAFVITDRLAPAAPSKIRSGECFRLSYRVTGYQPDPNGLPHVETTFLVRNDRGVGVADNRNWFSLASGVEGKGHGRVPSGTAPGHYTLRLTAFDRQSGVQASKDVELEVIP